MIVRELLSSIRLALVTILVCAVAYPLAILGVAAVASPNGRLGSLIVNEGGQVVGSKFIAQAFSQPEYFWPRPSACGYDAAAAAGSNLSPANPAISERALDIIANLELNEGQTVPADLVSASGSGLDPHISHAAALSQAPRVAKARGMSENDIIAEIDRMSERIPLTAGPEGLIVNVLEINLSLDQMRASAPRD